jgi:hypothetical protein
MITVAASADSVIDVPAGVYWIAFSIRLRKTRRVSVAFPCAGTEASGVVAVT